MAKTKKGNKGSFKHGMTKTPEYRSWTRMRTRCHNNNSDRYPAYGGKGIKICSDWDDFEKFYSDMGPRPIGKSLDRIDNKLGYSKNNCRWATAKEQTMNRSMTKFFTYNSETLCYMDWAKKMGGTKSMINARIKMGWSVLKSITTPNKHKKND